MFSDSRQFWRRLVVALFRAMPSSLSKWAVFWLKPKYVIGVMALVVDDDGRLLVLHHTYGTRYTWRFPGGIKERHEHPFRTAERELWEEANIVARAIKVVGVVESFSTFDIAVYCELVEARPFQANPEVDGMQWIDPQYPQVSLPPEQVAMIQTLKEVVE